MSEKRTIVETSQGAIEIAEQFQSMASQLKLNTANFGLPQVLNLDIYNKAMIQNIEELDIEPLIPESFYEKQLEYQQKSLEILQSINQNTANLYTIVDLLHTNNEKQEQILGIFRESLAIATAKNKKEADSIYRQIIKKINETVENVDNAIKIINWTTTVYQIVIPMLDK